MPNVIEGLDIGTRFREIRLQTEKLCSPLRKEDMVVQPIVDVSPPKWHLGHTTWFFEEFVLSSNKEGYQVFDPSFAFIFNSYYESVGTRVIRTNRGNITRPDVDEVIAYRQYVTKHILDFIEKGLPDSLIPVLELGMQHEQQHQELLCYDIKYILGTNPIFPSYLDKLVEENYSTKPNSIQWYNIQEGIYEIGYDGNSFHFDNEMGRHKVFLHNYQIADRLITNGEYLEFIQNGGYKNFKYWLSEAWAWVNANNLTSPEYWHFDDNQWKRYALNGGLQPLDLDAPVSHVSFYEADAFAKWSGKRLPTEFEWEVACNLYSTKDDKANFAESARYEPCAANGNNQMYGDLWEWTGSAYRPYPYYEAPDGALGEYNGKFMINQMVLRGGSCATPQSHIRNTYRNFFPPELRWMFSGIRLASD